MNLKRVKFLPKDKSIAISFEDLWHLMTGLDTKRILNKEFAFSFEYRNQQSIFRKYFYFTGKVVLFIYKELKKYESI